MTKLKMLSQLKYFFCLFATCFKKSRKEILDKDDLMYQSGYTRVNNQLDIINVLTSIQKLKACMVAIMNEKRIFPDSSKLLGSAKLNYLKNIILYSDSEEEKKYKNEDVMNFFDSDIRHMINEASKHSRNHKEKNVDHHNDTEEFKKDHK